jgi:hypothetical protein
MNESIGWTEVERMTGSIHETKFFRSGLFRLFITASHAMIENRFLIPRLANAERSVVGKFNVELVDDRFFPSRFPSPCVNEGFDWL